MRPRLFSLAVLLTASLLFSSLAFGSVAQPAVPVYRGALPYQMSADQLEEFVLHTPYAPELTPGDTTEDVYQVSAPIEEVFAFYEKELLARPFTGEEIDPAVLQPDGPVVAGFDLTFYESEFDDVRDSESGKLIRSGQQVRNTLSKNRRPYQEGQWLTYANFAWGRKEANDDVVVYGVTLRDASFSPDLTAYKTKTLIVIQTQRLLSRATVEELRQKDEDEAAASLATTLAAKPPTESELGGPVYPGAVFSPELSAESTGGEYRCYIYLSTDATPAVVTFYERRTGKRAVTVAPGNHVILLRGKLAVAPEQGIAITTNTMLGGSAKTIIKFLKRISN